MTALIVAACIACLLVGGVLGYRIGGYRARQREAAKQRRLREIMGLPQLVEGQEDREPAHVSRIRWVR